MVNKAPNYKYEATYIRSSYCAAGANCLVCLGNMEAPTQIPATPSRPPPPPPTTDTTTTTSHRPEALATTKRKFHSLLESLTRPSSRATVSSTGNTFDSPAKRTRLEARRRLEASSPTTTSPTTAYIQSQLLSSRLAAVRPKSAASSNDTSGTGAPAAAVTEPNYLPSSHAAFLRRLKTFADLSSWTSKPDPINEVVWAKKGWTCVGINTVACRGGCEQRVVVALRPPRKDEDGKDIEGSEDYSVDVDEELVRRYVGLVNSGHDEECLWRAAGCRDDIYRLQIARPTVWQPQLKERYQSFVKMADALPEPKTLEVPFDVVETARQFPDDFFYSSDASTKSVEAQSGDAVEANSNQTEEPISFAVNHTALAFALLGWHGSADTPYSSPPTSAIATCEHCFRRLGLWLYKSSPSPTRLAKDTEDQANSSTTDTDAIPPPPQLDLHLNHRTYCPWISSESQCMPGSFSGLAVWEVLLRLISNTFGTPTQTQTSSGPITTPSAKRRQTLPTFSPTQAPPTISIEPPTRPTTSTGPLSPSSQVPQPTFSSSDPHGSHDSTTTHPQELTPTLRTAPSLASIANSTTAHYGFDALDEAERTRDVHEERERKKRIKLEREEGDKARFRKLRELGRAIGLGTVRRRREGGV